MDFSILYVLQHLHNAVLDRVMVGITSLGNDYADYERKIFISFKHSIIC